MADPRRSAAYLSDGEIEDEEVYCICRTSDTRRFMIGCDQCDEWFHGDCINITEEHAKTIKKFFCISCRDKNPTLQTVYKDKKIPKKVPPKPLEEKKNRRIEDDDDDVDPPFHDSLDDDDDDFADDYKHKKSSKKQPKQTAKVGRKPKQKEESRRTGGGRRRKRVDSGSKATRRSRDHSEHHHLHHLYEGPRQCYGPGCIHAARRGSKYCSEDCGLKLANNRILEILPHRIQQWQANPSVADELSSKALDKIRQEQEDAKKKLEELDTQQEALEKLIEKAKSTKPYTEEEEEDYDERIDAEADLTVYCVTCGHEVNIKVAPRHMDRCFTKYESQTSVGSIFKTKIDNLFCDTFNPQSGTYCKRLRVLCPEHSKDPKIGEDEVCGFPCVSSKNLFDETGYFCRAHKKKCTKHLGWEKLRRALIDMERVQQWLRIEELFEKEQRTRYLMANRGGVLALMLHQTVAEPSTSGHD